MGQHHHERNRRAYRRGQSCAIDTHIKREDEDVVAENVEYTSAQHAQCSKPGILIISKKGRQHLVEKEKRKYKFNGQHIFLRERKQSFICSKKP